MWSPQDFPFLKTSLFFAQQWVKGFCNSVKDHPAENFASDKQQSDPSPVFAKAMVSFLC